nr:hypothetical protein [Tanacetum cinerariifolium]
MGIESAATWDRKHNTWDGREELFGTIPVSPSFIFEKIAKLVPGLLSLTFNGFGFDLWAKLVPEFGFFDKQSFNVKGYQEKDKIRSKPDKNGKCGEARKRLKQLQWIKEEEPKKIQKEW